MVNPGQQSRVITVDGKEAEILTIESSWMDYLGRAPMFLVLVGGMVYGLITWNRHRSVSLFAFLGCLIMLVLQLGSPYVTTSVIHQMSREGATSVEIANAMARLGLINSLLAGVGMAFLLGAVFGWRKAAIPHP